MTWFARLTLGVLSLLVLARAASAQTPQYQIYFVQDDGTVTPAELYQPDGAAPRAPVAQGYGYSQPTGYPGGYPAPAPVAQGYSYSQGYSSGYVQGGGYGGPPPCCTGGYTPAPLPPPPAYSYGCCAPQPPRPPCQPQPPHPPHPPHGCPPPIWGEVTLNDSFFWGGGGVGPEYIGGGGGGGGGYAYAGAASYAYASASASARVSVGGGGGYKPPYKPPHRPHKPHKPGGGKKGCGGCR